MQLQGEDYSQGTSFLSPLSLSLSLSNINKIDRPSFVECAWGKHQIIEVSINELLRVIKSNTYSRIGGDITHNDLKHVFSSTTSLVPFIKVRRGCILLSFDPITCIIMHDRVFLKINDKLDLDNLIIKITAITSELSNQIFEVENYYKSLEQDYLCNSQQNTRIIDSLRERPSYIGRQCVLKREMLVNKEDTFNIKNEGAPNFAAMPFEMRIIEYLTSYACSYYHNKLNCLNEKVHILSNLVRKGNLKKASILMLYDIKEPIQELKQVIDNYNIAIEELVESDERVFSIQLSKIFFMKETSNIMYNHITASNREEVSSGDEICPNTEILLEHLNQEAERMAADVEHLYNTLKNIDSLVHNRIVMSHNTFQIWEVTCTILGVGIGLSSSLSSLFGMNFFIKLADFRYSFEIVSAIIFCILLTGTYASFQFKRKYGM